MARASLSVDEIISQEVGAAMARLAPVIARAIATAAAGELEKHLAVKGGPGKVARAGRGARPRRSRTAEITTWVADRNARRVPNFVIELTSGLDTKKKIVAKYGEGASFEKGKPLPKPRAEAVKVAPDRKPPKEAARVVSAR